MRIFVDESGDLGCDFNKKGTSHYFVMTALVCNDESTQRILRLAIKKTLRNKVNHGRKKDFIIELKGAFTPCSTKQYFYKHISETDSWRLYSLVVDKLDFKIPNYIRNPSHLYNFFSGYLFGKLNEEINNDVIVTTDRCKTHREIVVFNEYTEGIFYSMTKGKYNVIINHELSFNDKALQAVDIFCNGIYKKYENKDLDWYNCFKDKIILEEKL